MKAILDEIAAFTPERGFNVVAIDEYAMPGERLTLVGHCATESEAEKLLASEKSASPSGEFAIYGSADASKLSDELQDMARRDYARLGIPYPH